MPEACIELLGHDASFKSAPSVSRVNQVTIAGHHESHKRDAHSILVKEDVRVRAGGRNSNPVLHAAYLGKAVRYQGCQALSKIHQSNTTEASKLAGLNKKQCNSTNLKSHIYAHMQM